MKASSAAAASGLPAASKNSAMNPSRRRWRDWFQQLLIAGASAGIAEHAQQGVGRLVDPRRLDLLDDVAGIDQGLGPTAYPGLHLIGGPPTGRIQDHRDADRRGDPWSLEWDRDRPRVPPRRPRDELGGGPHVDDPPRQRAEDAGQLDAAGRQLCGPDG